MTLITGLIADSSGAVLSGELTVTLDSPMVDTDTSPDTMLTTKPKVFTITSGVVNITLKESATQNTTYQFLFEEVSSEYVFYLEGIPYVGESHLHSDGYYYTGPIHTSDSAILSRILQESRSTVLDFHAIVPNVSSIEFVDLIQTGLTTDILDSSIRRLAYELTHVDEYIEALRGGPNPKGAWVDTTYYQKGDLVTDGGSSWLYINDDPSVDIGPSLSTSAYWQLVAAKGDPGGTGGNDSAYNATTWNGDTNAPSKNAVRDVIVTLATLASPAFTGTPTAPTAAANTNTTQIATTANVVATILARLTDAALTGNPTAATQANTQNDTRLATCGFVKNVFHRYSRLADVKTSGTAGGSSIAGINTRDLNTIDVNAGDVITLASNTFTLRPGTYRIRASAPAYGTTSNRHRLILWNNTSSTRVLNGANTLSATTGAPGVQTHAQVTGVFTIASNTDFQIRHYTQVAQASNGLGLEVSEASISEVYTVVELWRLD